MGGGRRRKKREGKTSDGMEEREGEGGVCEEEGKLVREEG